MTETTYCTPEMSWQQSAEFPGSVEVKTLRDERPQCMTKTLLVHLSAGSEIIPHSHLAPVQHFVLEGEYETGGKVYQAGTYRLLPVHATIETISTKTGATVLMIYDPVQVP